MELQHLEPAEQAVSPAPVKELQAAQRALALLLASEPLPALFRALARTAAEATGADLASIELLAPDRQTLVLAAVHGLPGTPPEGFNAMLPLGEDEAATNAPRLLAPVLWPSCDAPALRRPFVPLGDCEGVRALVAFPIAASDPGSRHHSELGERLLGRLTLYFRRIAPLLPVEIERGLLHAQVLAALLERERMAAERERRATEKLEGEDHAVLRGSPAPPDDAPDQLRDAGAAFFDIPEEHRAKEVLEAALGSIEDHFAMYDRDWRYVYVNRKAAEILGWPREALLGRRVWDVFPEAVGNLYYRECHRAMQERSIVHFENYYAPWDRWFENHLYPSDLGLSVFATDITERKRTEAELERARRLSQRITEAMPDTLFVYDLLEQHIVYASQNLSRLLGYSSEQLASMPRGAVVTELIHPEDVPIMAMAIARLQRIGDGEVEEYELRCRHVDGDYRWIRCREVVFSRTPEGHVQQVLGVAQDVTAERHTLDALREREAFYRTLGEVVPDFIWMIDSRARILYANQRWRDYVGIPVEEFDEDGWYGIHHPDEVPLVRSEWHKALAGGHFFTIESRVRRHDGVYRWFLCRVAPVHDANGVIQRWVGTTTDIDDRRRAEEALKEADHRKDEFLAMLSHELRNPLAPIQTTVELLRLQSGTVPGVVRACDIIVRQTRHLTRLVEDLLEVSRITRGDIRIERQRVDAASLCARAVETTTPFMTGRGHHFTQHLPEAPIELVADPTRIAQVLANLLHNAAKYTDPGGRIELSVLRESGQAAGQEGDQVIFRVRDSGIGIPPDMLDRIFDPFTQIDHSLDRSQGGLGIGLTLVRKLVALHGGSVHAASEGPGQGAEFTVRLPALPAVERMREPLSHQTSPLASPPVATSEPAPRRILLVDDNLDAAETLAEILTLWGHEVHLAHDGETALQRYREFAPEVVLLDIGLPKLDGYEVARRLREAPHPPRLLVALTGYGQAEDRRRSSEAGFDHHLIKPFDPSILGPLLAHLP